MTDSASPPVSTDNARPLVARPVNNRATWLFAAAAGLTAIVLFGTLEARRAAKSDPQLAPGKAPDNAFIQPPPPLAIPDAERGVQANTFVTPNWPAQYVQVVPQIRPVQLAPAPRGLTKAASPTYMQSSPAPYYLPQAPIPSGPALVYQNNPGSVADQGAGTTQGTLQRVHASRFDNPATTVPQGSVIQAVLETALDSTRAGPARAIVSRDVRGFDGTRVLIPRGSRLYGEYKSDVSSGQNRAMIQWTRLMRPDGVMIALDSPSADPLGRAGVKGKVNSHFFAQFGSALLQSTLNLGVGLATRNVGGGTVVLGLPGSSQTIAPAADSVKPTLKVAQGTPVSVFVAHDLDFTEVER